MAWKTEKQSTELCRLLSKRGITSRKIATQWIEEGKVRVNGKEVIQADKWVSLDSKIEIKDSHISEEVSNSTLQTEVYLLNKKRGWVTTRSDEKNRETVYLNSILSSKWLIPIGRLDQASEGLLLFTNDTQLSH
jgi:23S rRNA pseudouridine2605 synthase